MIYWYHTDISVSYRYIGIISIIGIIPIISENLYRFGKSPYQYQYISIGQTLVCTQWTVCTQSTVCIDQQFVPSRQFVPSQQFVPSRQFVPSVLFEPSLKLLHSLQFEPSVQLHIVTTQPNTNPTTT